MISAASPEGTRCSATVTRPLPPKGSSTPTRPAAASCLRVTRTRRAPPATRSTTQKIAPASAKRTPAARSGGMVSTITRIAR